jgi:uncharacterized protein YjbI with pentapeptide repeats
MTIILSSNVWFIEMQDLSYVDFSYASLQNVLFSHANLLCAKFRVGVISYSCNALCPEHLLIVFALYFPETCTVVTAMNSLDLTMSVLNSFASCLSPSSHCYHTLHA